MIVANSYSNSIIQLGTDMRCLALRVEALLAGSDAGGSAGNWCIVNKLGLSWCLIIDRLGLSWLDLHGRERAN